MPEKALEELLDVVACRRGDGREVPLAQFPMAQQMSSAETVRAEEITLSVPDFGSAGFLCCQRSVAGCRTPDELGRTLGAPAPPAPKRGGKPLSRGRCRSRLRHDSRPRP